MHKDIAVVIPTYNHAELLKQTLDSILSQTYQAAEIMVVDDGSTDNTSDVLANYAQKGVKSFRMVNGGPSAARKAAAEATRSPWLAFCDHDDLWEPSHLERRALLLSKYPDTSFSFADGAFFGPGATAGAQIFSFAPKSWWGALGSPDENNCCVMGSDFYRNLLTFNPAWPTTTVVRRELYDKIGGIDPRYSRLVNEDSDMTRKFSLHGVTLCDFTVTSRLRRHAGNTSGSVTKALLGKCQILEDHISLGVAPVGWHGEVSKAINQALLDAFLAAYYAEDVQSVKLIANKLGVSRMTAANWLRLAVLSVRKSV